MRKAGILIRLTERGPKPLKADIIHLSDRNKRLKTGNCQMFYRKGIPGKFIQNLWDQLKGIQLGTSKKTRRAVEVIARLH